MDELPKQVRKFVYDYFQNNSVPPTIEEIMRGFTLNRTSASSVLQQLQTQKQLVMVKDTQRILMAWPFSGLATPFKVTTDRGKKYFANCAWDALALHVMLDEAMQIESFCHHCAETLEINLKEQHPTVTNPQGILVYISLPARRWWDDVISTCSNNMVFFSSRDHLNEWIAGTSERGEALSVEQTLKISVPIYRGRMSLDYTRPPREEIQACFESAGLTGDFWAL